MMKSVRRRMCLGALFLVLCGLTGCEQMEHGPAANLPFEVTGMWVEEVQAEVESSVMDIEDIRADVEKVVGEAENAVAEAERLAEELAQGTTREIWSDEIWAEAGLQETQTGNEPQEIPNEAGAEVQPADGEAVLPTDDTIQENVGIVPEGTQPDEVPLPEVYQFTHSEKAYFEDALFIGDSRTMGLKLYGNLDNADYFAEPGLSLYSIPKTKLDVGEHKKIKLTELLEKEAYGKIYLMLGINELGYNFETTLEKYHALVEELRTKQPEAVLYVCANLHVTSVRDKHDEIHNNANIDKINAEIEAIADEQDIFYLDVNVLFDDEEGNLDKEIASDDSHILGEYYDDWCEWLGENTVVK